MSCDNQAGWLGKKPDWKYNLGFVRNQAENSRNKNLESSKMAC